MSDADLKQEAIKDLTEKKVKGEFTSSKMQRNNSTVMSNYVDFNDGFGSRKKLPVNHNTSEHSLKVYEKNISSKLKSKMDGQRNSLGGLNKGFKD